MTALALVMVLASAFLHATWNLFAKRIGGGATTVWLYDSLSLLIYTPLALALLLFQPLKFGPVEIGFIVGSAVLHLAYFVLLQRGYRAGDLSLVYPLARGTGPVLSTTAAILLLGERPGLLAIGGAVLVAVSVFVLTGGRKLWDSTIRRAVGYGLLTGVLIAGYTLWDKQAVSAWLIPPILLYYFSIVSRVMLLAPYAVGKWSLVQQGWRNHRFSVIMVALLSPLSYFLVLTALVFTPVSYVAPAREISILIGTVMGARLLSEGHSTRRIGAACGMVLGVIALALG